MTDEELKMLPSGTKLKVKSLSDINDIGSKQNIDWVDDMENYCGKEITIDEHQSTSGQYGYRVKIKEDNGSFWWYSSMLEPVSPPPRNSR